MRKSLFHICATTLIMPILLTDSTATALRLAAPAIKANRKLQSTRKQQLRPLSATRDDDDSTTQQQHLVLVGGGHAHAQVIKALNWASRPSNLKVTLIDQQASASYSGMVPGCICKLYSPEETLLHLEPLADWAGIEFCNDRVVDIDLENKIVYTADHPPLGFDCISMDIGSTSRGLDDTPGAREFTIPTRPISKLVERIDRSIDELGDDSSATPRVCVIGGGAAGVELSMSLNDRFQQKFPNNTQVTLLDSGTQLLPGESAKGREALQQIMNQQGIQVVHQCRVDEISDDRIFATVDKSPTIVPYTHCIWATGAGAHPLARRLQDKGLDATTNGWINVNEYLQSTSHPFLFAAGDCCHIDTPKNKSPPKAGVFAVRAGPVLIENLTRYLQQQQPQKEEDATALKPYVPQTDFLKLLVTGGGKALGFRFGQALHGKWVMQLKDKIDQNFMDLFKRENLPELSPTSGLYDTSQYDATMAFKTTLSPLEGAQLLARTDDDVDYQTAWSVLRTMAEDEAYRNQVLAAMEKKTQPRVASS